jgi:hypothetical protein
MRQYLIDTVHGQNLAKDMDEGTIGNILLKLDILDFKDFRHHIESIIDHDNMQETVILRVLQDFSEKGWISHKTCVENHARIMLRIDRKRCQEKWLKALAVIDLMDGQWHGDNKGQWKTDNKEQGKCP